MAYNISQKVLEQRRKAAQASVQARKGKKYYNSIRHGLTLDPKDRLKPCVSTCVKFPCRCVEEGHTQPGKLCLEKAFEVRTYQALLRAVKENDASDYEEIHCFLLAEIFGIVKDLVEKIKCRGVFFGQGENTKLNPAFLVLPKLLGDLGLSPGELLVTRRSKARADAEEQSTDTLASFLSSLGKKREEPKTIDVKQVDTQSVGNNSHYRQSLENSTTSGDSDTNNTT